MKKLVFLLTLVFILLSCDDGGMETKEETGPFSLIGTWETSGEIVVNSDRRTYKCSITFNEADYIETNETKSIQGEFHLTQTYTGSYTREENRITGTYSQSLDYHNGNPPSGGGPFNWSSSYKFANKNTLEFKSIAAQSMSNYISGNLTYKRKN